MAAASFKEFSKLIADKIKLGLVLLQKFINERNPREKQMIIVLSILGIIFLDYWFLINPVVKIFTNNYSQFKMLQNKFQELSNDQKNKKVIEKNWNQIKEKLGQTEKCFVAPDEMPAFLENISKLAQNSGVKVLSLQPLENLEKSNKKDVNPYTGLLIKMSAVGGTHEFGKFLFWLETNPTFIKVTDPRISANSVDDRKHLLELTIEVYRKETLL